MKFLLLFVLLVPGFALAEFVDFSSKWASEDNYRIQSKFHVKSGFFADLEAETSHYTENSSILLNIRRIGVSYGIETKLVKIYAGINYADQQSPEFDTQKWQEYFVSAHYRVENYPLLIDVKYTVPKNNVTSDVNPESKANTLNVGIGYEITEGLFLRVEKTKEDFYLGFRKWF